MATLKGLMPTNISKPVYGLGECIFIAEYDEDKLEAINEQECLEKAAFWRGVNGSLIDWLERPWQPRVARKYHSGIFGYICYRYGISQPRNLAAIIGDIAQFENKTPIEFFNSLPWRVE